jgi:hypothetical protein
MIQKVSNFKILQEPYINRWLEEHIFGKHSKLKTFLAEDLLLTSTLGILITFLVLFGLIKFNKTPKLVKAIKDKIMYSSIFRG